MPFIYSIMLDFSGLNFATTLPQLTWTCCYFYQCVPLKILWKGHLGHTNGASLGWSHVISSEGCTVWLTLADMSLINDLFLVLEYFWLVYWNIMPTSKCENNLILIWMVCIRLIDVTFTCLVILAQSSGLKRKKKDPLISSSSSSSL